MKFNSIRDFLNNNSELALMTKALPTGIEKTEDSIKKLVKEDTIRNLKRKATKNKLDNDEEFKGV